MSTGEPPLSVEFDDIIYRLQRFGGITQYWRAVTRGIAARPDFTVRNSVASGWQRFRALRSTARIFHSSYLCWARGRQTRSVITVHDLAYELGHLGSGLRCRAARLERRRAYFAADALVCVSESTRRDLLAFYPALSGRCLISVAHHGPTLDGATGSLPLSAVNAPLDRPYVLFVGGRGHYKNFEAAVAAFSASGRVADGWRLVCTGAPLSHEEAKMLKRYAVKDRVISVGNIGRSALVTLYQRAHCLLYPSRFEGFGMPVLEAMNLGCPVIALASTSIPEIAGTAALLIEDGESEATTAGLAAAITVLGEPAVRARLVAAGHVRAASFCWASSVDAHARIYHELA